MKTGLIGLGNLGRAMAKRLISQGVDLIVWNRTKDKASDLGADFGAVSRERLLTVRPSARLRIELRP